jgi:hypothetical protein
MDAKLRSLMSRVEHRLSLFENKLLVGVFGLNRGGVRGGSGNLHDDYLSNLYFSPSTSIIRMNK